MNKLYYFGPMREAGHYLWHDERSKIDFRGLTQPWGTDLDGRLAPPMHRYEEIEGRALLHHKDGWTALSFWDRTVDKRPGCSSTYLINEILSFENMVDRAAVEFPNRWSSMKFAVINIT